MNYLEVIGICYPSANAYTKNDPTNYNDIVWVTTPISKATLDIACPLYTNPPVIPSILQLVTANIPPQSTTALIPYGNNAAPTITDGGQVVTQSITPQFSSSAMLISFNLMFDISTTAAKLITTALFRGNVLICTNTTSMQSASKPAPISIIHVDSPGTTSPVTYSVRVGAATSTTTYINQGNSNTVGGSAASSFVIMEIKA